MSTDDKEPKIEDKEEADSGAADASAEADKANSDGDAKDQPTESRRGAKRRIIDETLLDEDEARRLESRRAYNRQCAAKARKRSKDLISHLQQQVEELSKDKASLERTNEVMQAQLQLLEQQNRTLMMNQRGPAMMAQGQFLGAGGGQGGNFPSVSFLESLSAQGRLAQLQQGGEGQQGGMPPVLPRAPPSATGGAGGLDANKYYLS